MSSKWHKLKWLSLLFFLCICFTLFFIQKNRLSPERPKKTEKLVDNTLIFGFENDVFSLDPIKGLNIYELQIVGQIFEGLVGLDKNNQVVPLLAEKWTSSPDYKTWSFKIRKGVYFHKDTIFGQNLTRQVTSEDVKYSFTRILSKESASSFALLDVIKGAQAYQSGSTSEVSGLRTIDSDNFIIELEHPEPFFISRITSPLYCVFPKEAVMLGPDVFGKSKAIGTGPFKLVSKSDVEINLEKNPDYWCKTDGNVSHLKFLVIKNDQIRLTELKNNKIDIMVVPLSLAPALIDRGNKDTSQIFLRLPFKENFRILSFKTFNIHFIGFNCEKLDIHLRKAISLAINRKELTKAVTFGTGKENASPIPSGLSDYQSSYQCDIFDIEAAKKELAKSQKDLNQKIEILVHEKDNSELIGQLVQNYLSKIGLNITLKKLDFNSVIGAIIKGDATAFSMFIEFVFSSPEPVFNSLFLSSKIPAPNFWRYNNPEVDKECESLKTITTSQKADSISRKIEKMVVDEAPMVCLYQLNNLLIFRKNVSNVFLNGHNIPLLTETTIN